MLLTAFSLFRLGEIRILQVQKVELVPFARKSPFKELIEAGPCC